jgi:hypothetical protein
MIGFILARCNNAWMSDLECCLVGMHEFPVEERTGADMAPGDLGTGYFGVKLDNQSAKQLRLLNVEVSNGRLAMLGILGMFASENVHGETHFFG